MYRAVGIGLSRRAFHQCANASPPETAADSADGFRGCGAGEKVSQLSSSCRDTVRLKTEFWFCSPWEVRKMLCADILSVCFLSSTERARLSTTRDEREY